MPRLTQLQVKNAKPGRHADGDGLYLLVSPTGGKSWVLRVQVAGKRHDYGLGPLWDLSISEAREKALEGRRIARRGGNPAEEWKRQNARVPTFKEAAEAYYESRKGSWKNAKHADQWISTLRTYAYPQIGKLTVDRIDAAEIQSALVPIWQEKGETARRVRQRIGTVLDHCKAMGWRSSEAPMRAVNTVLKGLKQPKKGNFPAMPYKDVPAFIAKLGAKQPTVGSLALQFLILTAARSGEVRGATWSEIDFEQALWTIPAERMKMERPSAVGVPIGATTGRDHRVREKRDSGRKAEVFPDPPLRKGSGAGEDPV